MEASNINVLAIDDEAECYRLTLGSAFSHLNIDFAVNIAEAKAKIAEKDYQVAFLDINLAGENGVDLIPFLQERGVAISLFSSEFNTENTAKAARYWVETQLYKPFLLEQFERMVYELVDRDRLAQFLDKNEKPTARQLTSDRAGAQLRDRSAVKPEKSVVELVTKSVGIHKYVYLMFREYYPGRKIKSYNVLESNVSTNHLSGLNKLDPDLRFDRLIEWTKPKLRDSLEYKLALIEWMFAQKYIDSAIKAKLIALQQPEPVKKPIAPLEPQSLLKIGSDLRAG